MEGFTITGIILLLLAAVLFIAFKKKPVYKTVNIQTESREVAEVKPTVKRVYKKKKKEISGESEATSSSTEGGTKS